MPFATENDIRNEGFLDDVEQVPSAQLQLCLARAHTDVLNETVLTDESEVPPVVVRAEAILAIAHYLRARAIAQSVGAEKWKTATMQVDGFGRVRHLADMAAYLRDEAWGLLRAYHSLAVEPSLVVTRGDRS
jgi:hypothetical protein